MDKNKIELAIYLINLKIAKETKEFKEKDYNSYKSKIIKLKEEKEEIYKNNKEIIEKVINIYGNELKNGGKNE